MPKKFNSTSINNPRCQPQTTFSSIMALKHWPKDIPIKEENTLPTTLMSLMCFQDFKPFCWRLLLVKWRDNCIYISAAKKKKKRKKEVLFSKEKEILQPILAPTSILPSNTLHFLVYLAVCYGWFGSTLTWPLIHEEELQLPTPCAGVAQCSSGKRCNRGMSASH